METQRDPTRIKSGRSPRKGELDQMNSAYSLQDRINRVIHTTAFESSLQAQGLELIDFQCHWPKVGETGFDGLPKTYREAILDGERELNFTGEVVIA